MDREIVQGPDGPVELTGELSPDFEIFNAQVFFSDASYSRLEEACQDYAATRRGGDGGAAAFAELPRFLGRAENASKAARDTAQKLLTYGEMDDLLFRDVEAAFRLLCRRTGKIQDLRSHIEGVALSMDVDYLDLVMRIGRSLSRDQTSLDGYVEVDEALDGQEAGGEDGDDLDDEPAGGEDRACGDCEHEEDGDVYEDFREDAGGDSEEDESEDSEVLEENAGDEPGGSPAEEPESEPPAEAPAEEPAEPRKTRTLRRRRE